MKFSYLQTTMIFNALRIQKTRALNKFVGLKNYLNTTFELIITRAKLIKLLMPCHNISNKVLRKKKLYKLKIPRSFINSTLCWLEFWVEHFEVERRLLSLTTSPHLEDNSFITALSVLRQYSKSASSQRFLYSKCRRYENEIF